MTADESQIPDDPLLRLSAAIDAFLVRQDSDGTEAEADFLARNEPLRHLLEPMLHSRNEAPGDGDGERYLGDYRLVRELGRGGMGVVFEAEEVHLGRRVALKILPPHLTHGPRRVERFRREAAAAARLQHPGIVKVHGVGERDGTHFFAMELVDGPTLHEVITDLRARYGGFADGFRDAKLVAELPGGYVSQTLETVAQVAEAVASAHAQGVIHRDLKPHNLMLDDTRVRVVDFGLARDLDRQGMSHSAEVAGTLEYMSPEQAAGLRETDHRTDVYSIGVLLFELLTLQRPFEADTPAALMQAIESQEAPSIRRLSPRVPRDIEVICRKCLEKSPGHRYQTAAELAKDLRRFQRHEPIEARPPGSATRLLKFARRRMAATIALLLAIVLPGFGVALYYTVYRPHVESLEQKRRDTMQSLRDTAKRQLLEATSLRDEPGRVLEAEAITKSVVETCTKLIALDDGPHNRHFLGWARQQLGCVWSSHGRLERARRVWEESYADLAGDEVARGRSSYLSIRADTSIFLASALHGLGEVELSRKSLHNAQRDIDRLRARGVETTVLQSRCRVLQVYFDYAGPAPRAKLRAQIAEDLAALRAMPEASRAYGYDEVLMMGILTLARLLRDEGQTPAAEVQIRLGMREIRQHLRVRPKSQRLRKIEATMRRTLADILDQRLHRQAAQEEYERAIAGFVAVLKDRAHNLPTISQLALARRGLAISLLQTGQRDKAAKQLRQAIAELRAGSENRPPTAYVVHANARVHRVLANVLILERTSDEEWAAFRERCTNLHREAGKLAPDSPERQHEWAQLEHTIAVREFGLRRYARAERLAQKALERRLTVLRGRPNHIRFSRFRWQTHLLLIESMLFQRKGAAAAAQTHALAKACAGAEKPPSRNLASNFARAASLLGPRHGDFAGLRDTATEHARRAVAQGTPRSRFEPRGAFAIMRGHSGWQKLLEDR